jgi:hypothetical protein
MMVFPAPLIPVMLLKDAFTLSKTAVIKMLVLLIVVNLLKEDAYIPQSNVMMETNVLLNPVILK